MFKTILKHILFSLILIFLVIVAGCKTSSTLSFDVKESTSPKNHIGMAPSISFKVNMEQRLSTEKKNVSSENIY